MKLIKIKATALFIFFLFIALTFSSLSVSAEDDEEELTAEINAKVIGNIPAIKTSEWTPIKIKISDKFGLNWTWIRETFPELLIKFTWPLIFGRDINNYLGYTSLRFEPEIYIGDENGWEMKVEPSLIEGTTGGQNHEITLYAQVDELAADYSVVIGIKCSRLLSNGDVAGVTYITIPAKAKAFNYIQMKSVDVKKTTTPKSIIDFKIDITNEGFYEDIFKFNVTGENGAIGVISESALFLKPGETKTITLQVLTPDKFFDAGTPHKMEIYVYSINDPEDQYIGTVIVETEGFHFSMLAIMVIGVIIIFLAFLFLLLTRINFKRTKKEKKIKTKEKTKTKLFKKSKKEESIEPFQPIDEELQEFEEAKEPKKKQTISSYEALETEKSKSEKEKAITKISAQQEKQKRKLRK